MKAVTITIIPVSFRTFLFAADKTAALSHRLVYLISPEKGIRSTIGSD